MKYPQPLQKGETIGLVAPSFGACTEPYASCLESAKQAFHNLGYNTKEYTCVRKCDGIGISSTPSACSQELVEAFGDPQTQVLFSVGGGELMCETIARVNFEELKQTQPKWFMGYSDNTNLGFLLTTLLNTASIYAPCAPTFGMLPWHKSLKDTFSIVCGVVPVTGETYANEVTVQSYEGWERESLKSPDNPLVPYNITEQPCMSGWLPDMSGCFQFKQTDEVTFRGRLLVGCLDCLQTLVGTKFDEVKRFQEKYPEPIVWALEACDLSPMGVRRALWQMKYAGWFEHVAGFVFGRPYRFEEEAFGITQTEAVLSAFEELGISVSVVVNADIGHLPPQMPLVCGSLCTVRYKNNQLTVRMQFA